ncbi:MULTISPECIES: DUF2381 family protein [unclassified Corallococcus]|uniref:DUF2381 family protein n=1 Tax=unclassified Corallococcus TaxID=2685029 RepID=UPI001A8E4CA9|nr:MULTISPECIES: DUF2381 family protein [unclassified Corallococcus]MBN9683576.1 DUF2381 family protein [Corallococcus sp. NCSPR001]WAS84912.1 DUF2381 family protein [Corallococcus sp. NCRR]
MLQPLRLALPLTLMLAWGATAQAQQATRTRAERKRAVTIASTSADPLPIVHVAGDTPTLFLFTSPIQKKTLTFDESRLRVLDAGERSVIVQPVADLREGERQEIGVFFADGQARTRAAFVLVTDPAEVDSRIDVQRPEPPNTACQPMPQAPAPKPEDFVLLGYVDKGGVTTSSIQVKSEFVQGLALESLYAFRGAGWILTDMWILNRSSQSAWSPQEATFLGRVGVPLRARLVTENPGPIPPGEGRRVLAVVEVPETEADLVFTLEVRGEGGRRLTIPGVRFPLPVAGAAR